MTNPRIDGGIVAYKDCADFCERLSEKPFPNLGLTAFSEREHELIAQVTRLLLGQMAEGFRNKADNLARLVNQ